MTRELWDRAAATFDDEPDHGLADPTTRAAWRSLLLDLLPAPPARVADLGCGTGTLSRLLVDEGYDVEGLDHSPEMVARARAKVPEAAFAVGDAAAPPFEQGAFDVVLSRHVLWAMPDPEQALTRWVGLLRAGGCAVLVEGSWSTGAGLTAAECERIAAGSLTDVVVRGLPEAVLWGRRIDDERYVLTGRR